MSEWVKFADEFPEVDIDTMEGRNIFVYSAVYGIMFIAKINVCLVRNKLSVMYLKSYAGTFVDTISPGMSKSNIFEFTHWMRMPELPKN